MRPIVVRDEEPPDDTVVVVRGGEMNGDTVRRTASDAFDEFGIYTVSVFLALDDTVESSLSGPARAPAVRQGSAHDSWSAADPGVRTGADAGPSALRRRAA